MRSKVVIVGAGFAGLYAAKALRRAPVDVLMIDQNNYHTFQPLLYQVATAGLEAGQIAHSVRGSLQGSSNIDFLQASVSSVDQTTQAVILDNGEQVPYDYLIMAIGAVYNDFGISGVREHAYFLKSLTEAVNLRSHILSQFEKVNHDPSLIDQGALNFVIVGGGPTGVEMAGAMVELFDLVLPKDYPQLDMSRARVILLEMQDALLTPYSESSRNYTEQTLRQRGVDIRFKTAVTEVTADEVRLADGDSIASQTMIWAAGIRGHPLVERLGYELTRGYRVKVNSDLRLPHSSNIFVIGDLAGSVDEDGKLYPQVAQVAMQQGKHTAKQIQRLAKMKTTQAFRYFDKGIMAIIGRNAGVAELSPSLGGFTFKGLLGWLSWLFIHLIYLVGFQNRVTVLANWAYSYFTYDRHARLISPMEASEIERINRGEKTDVVS